MPLAVPQYSCLTERKTVNNMIKGTASQNKFSRKARCSISLLLSLVLLLTCFTPMALGAEGEGGVIPGESALTSEVSSQPEDAPPQESSSALPEEITAGGEKTESQPQEGSGESSEPDGGESSKPEEPPAPKTYTVLFVMGTLGNVSYQVEEGQYLAQTPDDPTLPGAAFLGWFDEEGNQTYPSSLPIDRDRKFTARFSRSLGDLLNTTDHIAYIGGHENGMFKPEAGLTRAEAAKMFYALLRSHDWEIKTFPDVPASKWYADPVGTMATLGIVGGYENGAFRPDQQITRAEFVKMAVSFDTIQDGELIFPDVSPSSWAVPYIVTATQNGWINGYKDGFHPEDRITRSEAVTIINRMLGRSPDAEILSLTDTKNFYDVFPTDWAYGQIAEAATTHTYLSDEAGETWTDYEKDESVVEKSHWIRDGADRYYLDAKTRKFLRGEVTLDGVQYLLDASTGKAITGFRNRGSWRRYYKDGVLQNDISSLGVVEGPYFIKVYKKSNYLIIFAKDEKGNYNIPVRAMRVSFGNPTPTGNYYTPARYRWLQMVGDTWAQWCTQIQGNYLFHSVPNWTLNNFDLEVDEYNHLGDTRSLGCIRLNCRDAKWIFDNCTLGTKVTNSGTETSGPLSKPDGLQIPSWHTWDPTDPTAVYRCKQIGCH